MVQGPRGPRVPKALPVGKTCWPLPESGVFPWETALRGVQCRAGLYEPLSLCSLLAHRLGHFSFCPPLPCLPEGQACFTSPLHRVLMGQSSDSAGPAA